MKTIVLVTALASRRCRAGLCFGKDPVQVEVTAEQLQQLEVDPYLRVKHVDNSDADTSNNDGNDDKVPTLVDALVAAGHTKASPQLTVAECKELVGIKVTAAQRDAAWELLPEPQVLGGNNGDSDGEAQQEDDTAGAEQGSKAQDAGGDE